MSYWPTGLGIFSKYILPASDNYSELINVWRMLFDDMSAVDYIVINIIVFLSGSTEGFKNVYEKEDLIC
jgi:hypothetical protein